MAEKDSGFSILSTSGDEASKLEIDIQSARLPSGKKIAPYLSWRYTGTCGGAASIQADVRRLTTVSIAKPELAMSAGNVSVQRQASKQAVAPEHNQLTKDVLHRVPVTKEQ
jgi:hypothetical protein